MLKTQRNRAISGATAPETGEIVNTAKAARSAKSRAVLFICCVMYVMMFSILHICK